MGEIIREVKNELKLSKEQKMLLPIAESYLLMFPEIAKDKTFNAKQAVISMALKLKETTNKAGRPAIDVCTKESIMQVAQEVLVKRLDIMKSQASLIVRGDKLMLQAQYQGNVKRALELNPFLSHFNFVPIYKNDKIEMEIDKNGNYGIKNHTTSFANIGNDNILGGYVRAIKKDGSVHMTEVMTIEQIKISWSKSSSISQSVHKEFPLKMVRKTILNSLCAWLINTTGEQEEYMAVDCENSLDPTMELNIDESQEISELNEDIDPYFDDQVVPETAQETEGTVDLEEDWTEEEKQEAMEELMQEESDEQTVSYYKWLNDYKNNGYEMVKDSYDKVAKTVKVRRV